MNHRIHRHTGNVLAVLGLLIVGLAGLDWLQVWLDQAPTIGCWLRPVLMLGQTLAVWAASIGVILIVMPWTRPAGMSLLVAGILVAILPGILAAHVGVSCAHS